MSKSSDPPRDIGRGIQGDTFIRVHRQEDVVADRIAHMTDTIRIALRPLGRDAHKDFQALVALGDQAPRHLHELIPVIGTEAEGDVDIGIVAMATKKLGDRAAGGLADQIPKGEIQTGKSTEIDPAHMAALGDEWHQASVNRLEITRIHALHGRRQIMLDNSGNPVAEKLAGHALTDQPTLGLHFTQNPKSVTGRLSQKWQYHWNLMNAGLDPPNLHDCQNSLEELLWSYH